MENWQAWRPRVGKWRGRCPVWSSCGVPWLAAAPRCSGSPGRGWPGNQKPDGEREERAHGGWGWGWTPWRTLPGGEPHLEGVFLDGFDDVLEEDLWGEGVAVVDHRLVVWSIPAVQLHTAAALQQSPEKPHRPRCYSYSPAAKLLELNIPQASAGDRYADSSWSRAEEENFYLT